MRVEIDQEHNRGLFVVEGSAYSELYRTLQNFFSEVGEKGITRTIVAGGIPFRSFCGIRAELSRRAQGVRDRTRRAARKSWRMESWPKTKLGRFIYDALTVFVAVLGLYVFVGGIIVWFALLIGLQCRLPCSVGQTREV